MRRVAFLLRLLRFILGTATLRERSDVLSKAAKDVARNNWLTIANDHPRQRPRKDVGESEWRFVLDRIVEQSVRSVQISQLDLLSYRAVGELGRRRRCCGPMGKNDLGHGRTPRTYALPSGCAFAPFSSLVLRRPQVRLNHDVGQQKTHRPRAKAGCRTAAALAGFITRPQAGTQIGAKKSCAPDIRPSSNGTENGTERITECLYRAHGPSEDTILLQIVLKDPRWLTEEEYRASGRTDLTWFSGGRG
jgi:hypothetical protein